jgi:hypothetical protein
MKKTATATLSLLLVLGCAAPLSSRPDQLIFEWNVGTATGRDAYEKATKIIREHQFVIEREVAGPSLYIETRWRDRTPFPDEVALGFHAIQNRLVVRGTPRSGSSLGPLYAVSFTIENRVRIVDGGAWNDNVFTPQFRDYAQRISDDLRRELDVAVRRYQP